MIKNTVIFGIILVVIGWSLANFLPVNDVEFGTYLSDKVQTNEDDFRQKLAEAEALAEADATVPSLYAAMRVMGEDQEIDWATYFPKINLIKTSKLKIRNDALLKYLYQESKGNLKRGLDLKGGVSFTLEMKEPEGEEKDDFAKGEELSKAIDIMATRIDSLGVAEPVIRAIGNDRIEIQMPDLDIRQNPHVVDAVKKPAKLEFCLVHRTLRPSLANLKAQPPAGYVAKVEEREDSRTGETIEVPYYIKYPPVATGEILDQAYPSMNQVGGFEIQLRFTDEGAEIFENITGDIARDNNSQSVGQLAIVLDKKLYSAPQVSKAIGGGSAVITGNFDQREAFELSNVLNNPLEVELEVAEMSEVGPTLAEDALNASIRAAVIGAILVVSFMVLYYWLGGLAAVISVVCNVIILLGVLSSLEATMTLPGVAALVLTIGMAVDANILIFERIREELKAGKSPSVALKGGFDKALSTIVDANVTTLITAVILIYLGTGPVKGFGVTLSIGIGASMFCALVVSRFVLDILVDGLKFEKILGLNIMGQTNIDFLKFRIPAFTMSWCIVLIGVSWLVFHHDHIFGIDFVGGDELTLSYVEDVSMAEFEDIASQGDFGEVNPVHQQVIGSESAIIKVQTEINRGTEYFDALSTAFPDRGIKLLGESQIGASVSNEIQNKAFISIAVALLGILLYVAIRFEVGYGIGAVVATIHDVLMTLGIFVLFGGQFTSPMIAAVLMILGYSINDTIVVFDRIREELGLNPNASLKDIIRIAINRVLSRSILTSLTTFLAAFVLWMFGAGVINDFAFVFMIGIITGTFSSIFIASPVFYWWHKGDRKHVEDRDLLPKYDWQASSKGAEE